MIAMRNIQKSFGEQTVLQDVTFTIPKGQIFGLLGPSGSGKTTMINILTRQLDADSGTHEVGATPFEIGLMLEEDGLYTRLTVLENLNLFLHIYGLPQQTALRVLASVGLGDAAKKRVSALSKGMRQRLALARAILHKPKILFLDEPTANLDPATARGIHKLMKNLCDEGTTIFLTTHNMEEAVNLCDTVALLHKGVIVECGSPKEICEKHESFKTVPNLEAVFMKLTGVVLE